MSRHDEGSKEIPPEFSETGHFFQCKGELRSISVPFPIELNEH